MTEHCWHETGLVLCSQPPQIEEVCCYCDKRRHKLTASRFNREEEKGHGPYLARALQSSERVWYIPADSGPCEGER